MRVHPQAICGSDQLIKALLTPFRLRILFSTPPTIDDVLPTLFQLLSIQLPLRQFLCLFIAESCNFFLQFQLLPGQIQLLHQCLVPSQDSIRVADFLQHRFHGDPALLLFLGPLLPQFLQALEFFLLQVILLLGDFQPITE